MKSTHKTLVKIFVAIEFLNDEDFSLLTNAEKKELGLAGQSVAKVIESYTKRRSERL